jgi:hypothetical protein
MSTHSGVKLDYYIAQPSLEHVNELPPRVATFKQAFAQDAFTLLGLHLLHQASVASLGQNPDYLQNKSPYLALSWGVVG